MRSPTAIALLLAASLGCTAPGPAASEDKPGPPRVAPPAKPVMAGSGACEAAADCEAVGCECACTGGGLGLREEAVLKADVARWYEQRGCRKPGTCASAPCPPSRLACVGGACHVVYGEP